MRKVQRTAPFITDRSLRNSLYSYKIRKQIGGTPINIILLNTQKRTIFNEDCAFIFIVCKSFIILFKLKRFFDDKSRTALGFKINFADILAYNPD